MAVVINGNGTVTGISVGGLPDGIVDSGTLASNAVTNAKITDGAVDAAALAANSVDSAELIDGSIDTAHIAADQITSAILPAGSVLQVVKATGSSETQVTAAATWTDTYATVTITPSSTSNKIYLSHTAGGLVQSPSTGQSIGLRIKRVISGGATSYPYSSDRYHYMDNVDWVGTNWAVIDLDSPSTTSAITYTIEINKTDSSGTIRHCDTASWNFIAMEIAG